jgi:M6 family metalloprotease-like protein
MVNTTPNLLAALAAGAAFVNALPVIEDAAKEQQDPFAVLDPQNWENPDDMTWDDFVQPPGRPWYDATRKGSERNFNIALVAVDYPDSDFVITMAENSTVFTNPQAAANSLKRDDVPAFYRDLLNLPQELNRNHTLHEYWMEDSGGKFGVDLTAFGAYRMPSNSYQYGVDDEEGGFNEDACPTPENPGPCSVDLRTDALGAWRADVGNETADAYELVFILSAGQDESSTWQEFGEMMFAGPDDVPDSFGPPGNSSLPNWAHTRYVEWSSWASASSIWPNAGSGSSTQGESSGLGTYAHELTHLLGIGDNYNNPFGTPAIRSYTGPWSMMSRGSFNGPGGPHTRWRIPSLQGGSLGSLHTIGDKMRINLVNNASVLKTSRDELSSSGVLVADITARVIHPEGKGYMGVHIALGTDLSPACNQTIEPLCDGGNYNNYDLEVIDRMGSDSFQPDSGVMISKTKDSDRPAPFQWTIDANPQDIRLVDFVRANGSEQYITIGDYRQLADALFHAGTRSGSEYEYVDEANGLHFYIIEPKRDADGVLSYTVGVRSLNSTGESGSAVMKLSKGKLTASPSSYSSSDSELDFTGTCTFDIKNSGKSKKSAPEHLKSDVYRLSAEVEGEGWKAVLPNALATAKEGEQVSVKVAVGAAAGAEKQGKVWLTATSESDESVSVRKVCKARRI